MLPGRTIVDNVGMLLQSWFQYLSRVDEVMAACRGTGPTTSRPKSPYKGQSFFDETLGKPIWAKVVTPASVTWVDATGTTV